MKRLESTKTRNRTRLARSLDDLLNTAEDLDVHNATLFWAFKALPFIVDNHVEDIHRLHMDRLMQAMDVKMGSEFYRFYQSLPNPDSTRNMSDAQRRISFWTRYAFLVCAFNDRDDHELLLTQPPNTWEGNAKSFFFETELKGCPLPCTNGRALMSMRLEEEEAAMSRRSTW